MLWKVSYFILFFFELGTLLMFLSVFFSLVNGAGNRTIPHARNMTVAFLGPEGTHSADQLMPGPG